MSRGGHKGLASMHRLEFYRHKDDWRFDRESASPDMQHTMDGNQRPCSPLRRPRQHPARRGRPSNLRTIGAEFPRGGLQPPGRESRKSQFEVDFGFAPSMDLNTTYRLDARHETGRVSLPSTSTADRSVATSPLNTAFLRSSSSSELAGDEFVAGSHRQRRTLSLDSLEAEADFLRGAALRQHSSLMELAERGGWAPAPQRSYASAVAGAPRDRDVDRRVPTDSRGPPPPPADDPQRLFRLLSARPMYRQDHTANLINTDICKSSENNNPHEQAFYPGNTPEKPMWFSENNPQNRAIYEDNPKIYAGINSKTQEFLNNNCTHQSLPVDDNEKDRTLLVDINLENKECYAQDNPKQQVYYANKNLNTKPLSVQSPSFYPNAVWANEFNLNLSRKINLVDTGPMQQGVNRNITNYNRSESNLEAFARAFTHDKQGNKDGDTQNWRNTPNADMCKPSYGNYNQSLWNAPSNLDYNQNCVTSDMGYAKSEMMNPKYANNFGLPDVNPEVLCGNNPNVEIHEVHYKKTFMKYGPTEVTLKEEIKEIIREPKTGHAQKQETSFTDYSDYVNLMERNRNDQCMQSDDEFHGENYINQYTTLKEQSNNESSRKTNFSQIDQQNNNENNHIPKHFWNQTRNQMYRNQYTEPINLIRNEELSHYCNQAGDEMNTVDQFEQLCGPIGNENFRYEHLGLQIGNNQDTKVQFEQLYNQTSNTQYEQICNKTTNESHQNNRFKPCSIKIDNELPTRQQNFSSTHQYPQTGNNWTNHFYK